MRSRTLGRARAKVTASTSTVTTCLLGTALILGLGLGGCGDDDTSAPTFPVVGENSALLRVGHLSPDAGVVDVVVSASEGGGFTADDVGFGDFSGFVELPSTFEGTEVTVDVRAQDGSSVFSETFTLLREDIITVAAIGRVADLQLTRIRSTLTPSASEATVDFVHAAPGVGPVNVTNVRTQIPPLFSTTAFGQSSPGISQIVPRTYLLQIRDEETGDALLTFDGLTLAQNTIYTVWAVVSPSDEIELLVTTDAMSGTESASFAPIDATFRVAHLSEETEDLQVLVDGTVLPGFEAVPYKTISDPIEVAAATHRIQLVSTIEESEDGETFFPVYLDTVMTLAPDELFTYIVSGNTVSGEPSALPHVFEYVEADPAPGSSLFRFLHAASFTESLVLEPLRIDPPDSVIYSPTRRDSKSEVSDLASLPAGLYNFTLRRNNQIAATTLDSVRIDAGEILNMYLIGNRASAPERQLELLIDPQPELD
mgnify:CR=1 FL=1